MKTLILLDLDNTLFDSYSYRIEIFENIAALYPHNKKEQIIQTCQNIYAELRSTCGFFAPEIFLEKITSLLSLAQEKDILKQMMFDQKILQKYVHKEVADTLKSLSEISELGIFSQGETTLQKAKLASFFHLLKQDSIHITESKKKAMQNVFKLYDDYHVYFVDDVLPLLEKAKEIAPKLFTVWIKRGGYAKVQQPLNNFIPDAIIETLDELVPIVKKELGIRN